MVALKASQKSDLEAALKQFSNWEWRLDNLYTIEDKGGNVIPFVMNDDQRHHFHNMHYLNIILKARQLGFSTFIAMFILDQCLFNSNTKAGIIDITLPDAKKKLAKIKFAYDRIPQALKAEVSIVKCNETEIQFSNGSTIEVGISHRGGTLQILHISEFGKICAKSPEKAREIVTGALNTIAAGQVCFIESTAEGQTGRFYDMCQEAQEKLRRGDRLTALDFKFHFYPWHNRPEYSLDDWQDVVITDQQEAYFQRLTANDNISLKPGQKAWYVKKSADMQGDMKREYPSTPEEAFEASVEGAIFGPWIETAELEGRIGDFPAIEGVPVHTFWDIGRRDFNPIWFVQILVDHIRVVHFYENSIQAMPHYVEYCKKLFDEKGWVHGDDVFPHDIKVEEWGSGRSRIEQSIEAGFNAKLGTVMGLQDGINATRATFERCKFHQAGCADGIKRMKNYKWKWDASNGIFDTSTPNKDDNTHAADSFRTLGTSWRDITPSIELPPVYTDLRYEAQEDGTIISNKSVFDIVEAKRRKRERGLDRDRR